MSEYIRKIRTVSGDKQIDYTALANKPDCANALKGTATGEIIRLDDVSPMEHTAKVKVDGGNTSTVLTACGKNLVNHVLMPDQVPISGGMLKRNKDVITLNGTLSADGNLLNTVFSIYGHVGKNYSLSYEYLSGTITGSAFLCVGCSDSLTDTRQSWTSLPINNADNTNTYILGKSYIRDLWIYAISGAVFNNFTFRVQLEVGNAATEYETYKENTYTLDEDGACEVDAISSVMTLMTKTAGTTIECEYNRDINTITKDMMTYIDNTILNGEW